MSETTIKAIFSVLFAVVVTTLVVILIEQGPGTGGGTSFALRIPPAEFLYLDGPRVLAYLEQLEGGSVEKIHRITKEIRSVSGKLSTGQAELGASTQHENEADSILTRTESSELGQLVEDLRDDDVPGVALRYVNLTDSSSLKHIKEGWLVRFETHDLLSPGYIRPYVVVHQSATLGALFPRFAGNRAGARRSEREREKAEAFAKRVGPDPRITFATSLPPSEAEPHPLKILLPMHYLGLTGERSLLEKDQQRYTGGDLVVIGKVIRVFQGEGQSTTPAYTDYATREIWRTPLEHASRYLINRVSHSCITGHTLTEEEEGAIRGRGCLLTKLTRQTRVFAPGAVILPLAIYK